MDGPNPERLQQIDPIEQNASLNALFSPPRTSLVRRLIQQPSFITAEEVAPQVRAVLEPAPITPFFKDYITNQLKSSIGVRHGLNEEMLRAHFPFLDRALERSGGIFNLERAKYLERLVLIRATTEALRNNGFKNGRLLNDDQKRIDAWRESFREHYGEDL